MNLYALCERAANKNNFTRLQDYLDFAREYLDFIGDNGLQAEIVCQNEQNYCFWQFGRDGNYNVSRPINTDLMLSAEWNDSLGSSFSRIFEDPRAVENDEYSRTLIKSGIYTIQQCIGTALDGLGHGRANNARKLNGDLFERLIQLLIRRSGVDCESGVVKLPIEVDGEVQCQMSYQHDLILKNAQTIKAIGSVKTSSKDRIDKIFIDKFLFNQITEQDLPHLAIFLNDIQRAKAKQNESREQAYRVSATFLPGHFKGYTIKLNPLDGVYYCDLRPNMISDSFLSDRIKSIDQFFCHDLWQFFETEAGVSTAAVAEDEDSRTLQE